MFDKTCEFCISYSILSILVVGTSGWEDSINECKYYFCSLFSEFNNYVFGVFSTYIAFSIMKY